MKFGRTTKTLLLSILLAVATTAFAHEAPRVTQTNLPNPTSAIFIGNSFFFYNNSMHGHVREIISAVDKKQPFRGTSVTISGSGLDWHNVEAYFQPNGIGRYSFVANNKIQFNKLDK